MKDLYTRYMEISDGSVPQRIIIIHGTYGNPDENWFPYIKSTFAEPVEVVIPAFPTPENQSYTSWEKVAKDEIGLLTSQDILIGHSIGCAFLIRLLEKIEPLGASVKATFLVGSFMGLLDNEEFDSLNETFVNKKVDWDLVRKRAGIVEVWHGDNDPYVDESMGEQVAEQLNGKYHLVHEGGHLNAEAGFETFDHLKSKVKNLI